MGARREKLSAAAARRIALAAQGFAAARPASVHVGQMQRTIDRLGLLQIDSVNVLARAHYLPLFSQIRERGALAASELSNGGERRGPWWGWNDGKLAVEWLFFAGIVTTATRRGTFERVYDLTERVLPASVLALPTPSAEEAQRELLRFSARALGVATEFDLRDYFRLGVADTKARLAELVEAGELLPVTVEGWKKPAYLDPKARMPRWIEARALLAPFDPLVWERERTHRIFDFFYRIEIYTPLSKRNYGYYVLPFLLGDRLVGRVDLTAARATSRLLAHAVHVEPGVDRRKIEGPLREELRLMADWLGLDRVVRSKP
jgi:uncharacterized protein YcaQ